MRLRAALALFAVALLPVASHGPAAAQAVVPFVDANTAATAAIRNCVDRVGDDLVGLPELEQRCPDLFSALRATGMEPLIIDSSRGLIDRNSLLQLPTLIHRPAGPAPPVAALGPILRALRTAPAPPKAWWVRFLEWLGERLTPKKLPTSAPSWLGGLVRLLPSLRWLGIAIIWGTLIALPIAAAIVVMREVRALGKRSVDEPLTEDETVAPPLLQSRLALLRRAPPGQRPAQLFAMLMAQLVAAGRLPPDRSLTHREVTRRVRLEDAQQRHLLEALARLSEWQLYSGVAGAPAGLDDLLARGEDLYTTGWSRPAEP